MKREREKAKKEKTFTDVVIKREKGDAITVDTRGCKKEQTRQVISLSNAQNKKKKRKFTDDSVTGNTSNATNTTNAIDASKVPTICQIGDVIEDDDEDDEDSNFYSQIACAVRGMHAPTRNGRLKRDDEGKVIHLPPPTEETKSNSRWIKHPGKRNRAKIEDQIMRITDTTATTATPSIAGTGGIPLPLHASIAQLKMAALPSISSTSLLPQLSVSALIPLPTLEHGVVDGTNTIPSGTNITSSGAIDADWIMNDTLDTTITYDNAPTDANQTIIEQELFNADCSKELLMPPSLMDDDVQWPMNGVVM